MKVFKASLRVMLRHKAQLLIYFSIFTAIFVVISMVTASKLPSDFTASRPSFTIINRDEATPLTEGLSSYLSAHGNEVALNDEKKVLQDSLFYQETSYILIIPEGFRASLETAEPLSLETAAVSGTTGSYYLDSLVNRYCSFLSAYRQADPSLSDQALADKVLDTLSLETPVETVTFSAAAPVHEIYQAFCRVESYILLVLVLLSVSSVTIAFRRPDFHMRNLCAPISSRSRSLGLFLYCAVVGLAAWLVLAVTGFILSARYLSGADWRLIALLQVNSLLFTVTAVTIAMLVSYFIKNANTQSAFCNFMSLALSFLGGAFVPLEFLSSSLLAAAHFSPVYWYSLVISKLCAMTSVTASGLRPVFMAFLVQLCFAFSIFCAALAVGKVRNRSEKSFGTIHTELDL